MPFTATVLEVGGWTAHLSDEALEDLGNRFARPGVCHTDPDTVDMVEREGTGREVMVMGIEGQNGQQFPRAQANTDIEPPDEAVGKGRLAQGEAPQGAGRVDADQGEADDPMNDGLRTRRSLDAQSQSQESQDARDGAKANACLSKELQSQVDDVDLGQGNESVQLGLKLTQAGLSLFEGLGDTVALSLEARTLFALVALALASLFGFVFPRIPALVHFGKLAHDVCSSRLRWPEAMERGSGGSEDEPIA